MMEIRKEEEGMKTKATNIIYFPDKVQEELFGILDDVFYYSIDHFRKKWIRLGKATYGYANF